jgi:hypothetical protein
MTPGSSGSPSELVDPRSQAIAKVSKCVAFRSRVLAVVVKIFVKVKIFVVEIGVEQVQIHICLRGFSKVVVDRRESSLTFLMHCCERNSAGISFDSENVM